MECIQLGLILLIIREMKIKPIIMQPLWRTVWKFLKKLKTELTYDPAILPLGIYPEKTLIQKDACTSNIHSSTIYSSQDTETT